MRGGAGSNAEGGAANDARGDNAYDAVRADDTIQYAPLEIEPPAPPPDWLERLAAMIGDMFLFVAGLFGESWPVVKWVLIAAAVMLAVYIVWKRIAPLLNTRRANEGDADIWLPDRQAAVALLDDADRLAAAGDYDGATRLLLHRSVDQIAAARPGLVEPSTTARELASLAQLPQDARTAFATIATHVERSLFALDRLGRGDWETARDAYGRFASQSLRKDAA